MKKEKTIKGKKILKIISNILYVILFILILLVLLVVILQRVSNNSLSLGGYRIFNIASGSMLPKYEIGDVLISKEVAPSEIKKEDDIVYLGKKGSFNGKVVTHQVIGIKEIDGKYEFYTKGIANQEMDPVVEQDQVYGKVVYKVWLLSFISKMINNIYIFYFVIFIPIGILIYRQIRNIIYNIKNKDEDDTDSVNKEKEILEKKDEEKIVEHKKKEN